MTSRCLPPAEWSRLEATAGSALAPAWRALPTAVTVVVVEDTQGAIVGCWSLFACWHVEGVWVAPAHRKRGIVAKYLLEQMRSEVRQREVAGVITHAATPEVATLIETLHGVRLPGDPYAVPLGAEV